MISLLDVQRNETRAMRLEAVYHRKKYKEIFHNRHAGFFRRQSCEAPIPYTKDEFLNMG
jgi:hypothetical protein